MGGGDGGPAREIHPRRQHLSPTWAALETGRPFRVRGAKRRQGGFASTVIKAERGQAVRRVGADRRQEDHHAHPQCARKR